MANILIWIGVPIAGIIVGAVVVFVPMTMYNFTKDYLMNRKLKKMTREEWEKALSYKPVKINEKEVKEDGEERSRKFREFEKLRRLGEGTKTEERSTGVHIGEGFIQGRKLLPDDADTKPKPDSIEAGGNRKKVRLSD